MVFGRVGVVGVLGVAVLFSVLSCGGGSSPTTSSGSDPVAASTGTPTPAAAAATATPTPSPATGAGTTCPYGKGTLEAQCFAMQSEYVTDISNAITELARKRPDIFDLNDQFSAGQYRVVKTADYFTGLVQQLQSMGFCAEADGAQLVQVKKGNTFSEKYAVLTSGGYVRRGEGSYRDSCRPAVFPVDDVDHIDSVRVHFYGIRCPEGIAKPDNAEKRLPVGCQGSVSATPKDKLNRDVPAAIHGPDVVWEIFVGAGENLARVSDVPDQPFNKTVDAIDAGYFTMCATVKGVKGCFGFDIYHP